MRVATQSMQTTWVPAQGAAVKFYGSRPRWLPCLFGSTLPIHSPRWFPKWYTHSPRVSVHFQFLCFGEALSIRSAHQRNSSPTLQQLSNPQKKHSWMIGWSSGDCITAVSQSPGDILWVTNFGPTGFYSISNTRSLGIGDGTESCYKNDHSWQSGIKFKNAWPGNLAKIEHKVSIFEGFSPQAWRFVAMMLQVRCVTSCCKSSIRPNASCAPLWNVRIMCLDGKSGKVMGKNLWILEE